jgi:glucans biosynthesis protein C
MEKRLHYVDNLRVFCILIVVLIHTAVTYSHLGSWYYNEPSKLSSSSTLFFAFFQSHAQAFSMSLFFFIAGYFIPASLKRKGIKKFISDRLFRLGIPTLVFMLLLHPLCVKLAYPQVNIWEFVSRGIPNFEFIGWSGPLWFALTLLIFSIIYAFLYRVLPKIKNAPLTSKTLVLLVVTIAVVAFALRLVFPVGTSFINLQFCYFSGYIFMFSAGILARQNELLEKVNLRMGKKWMLIAFGAGIPLWITVLVIGHVPEGSKIIDGGFNFPAFLYAFWEALFCVAFIVALFGISKTKFNTQNELVKFMSDNVFGVYVFHAPVLIGISVLTKTITISPVLKFFIIGFLSIACSFAISWFIRQIPVIGKIFN